MHCVYKIIPVHDFILFHCALHSLGGEGGGPLENSVGSVVGHTSEHLCRVSSLGGGGGAVSPCHPLGSKIRIQTLQTEHYTFP